MAFASGSPGGFKIFSTSYWPPIVVLQVLPRLAKNSEQELKSRHALPVVSSSRLVLRVFLPLYYTISPLSDVAESMLLLPQRQFVHCP